MVLHAECFMCWKWQKVCMVYRPLYNIHIQDGQRLDGASVFSEPL